MSFFYFFLKMNSKKKNDFMKYGNGKGENGLLPFFFFLNLAFCSIPKLIRDIPLF